MSRSLKIGLALVLIGLGIVIGVSVVTGGDFFVINEDKFVYYEETYGEDDFHSFDFDVDNRKIYILPSDDTNILMKYYVNEKETYQSSDDNQVKSLNIDIKWYYNIFNFSNLTSPNFYEVYLYLPANVDLYTLEIQTSNGFINLHDVAVLKNVTLETSNGDLSIRNLLADNLILDTSNGEINLETVESLSNITAETSNGKIILDNVIGKDLSFSTSNGKIIASDIVSDNLKLRSSNGIIEASVIGNKEDYKIRLATSNGDRTLDGVKVDQSNFNTDKTKYINIQSSNGNVKLNFLNN